MNEQNIFLGIKEQNVTFCIDISGSMYSSLNTIKEQLIQYLLEQSLLTRFNLNRLFNLIAFSTEVTHHFISDYYLFWYCLFESFV